MLQSWIATPYRRYYPLSPIERAGGYSIEAALNERSSFQVALCSRQQQTCHVRVLAPEGWGVRVRRVGYVPLRHHNTPVLALPDTDGLGHIPGYVPDPLYEETELLLPAGETHAAWVSVQPQDARPGNYVLTVVIEIDGQEAARHIVPVRLYDISLQPRRGFQITHWFYIDALMDWYGTDLSKERFWEVLASYVRDVVTHGQDTLYVPVFTPPLDGVKRPSQLLDVHRTGPDTYTFDWGNVKRYIDLARECGITHWEWCHFFTQWGAKYAIRIYEGQGQDERLLWPPDTDATGETYRAFLNQYLPELKQFLQAEGLEQNSFFHVSDEPHGQEHLEQYRRDRAFLRELAPWMTVMDALTDIEFGRQGLTDMPIPSIRTALDFVAEEIPCWCYYCCGPRGEYLNRLLDTPLPKIAMHGLLFYRWPFQGFLHWGYNYWYRSQTRQLIDPYSMQDGDRWAQGWAYGDTFLVYPGANGPIDSVRWELFGESLQDYRLLQTLGIARDDALLAPLASFEQFPKRADWRRWLRGELFRRHG